MVIWAQPEGQPHFWCLRSSNGYNGEYFILSTKTSHYYGVPCILQVCFLFLFSSVGSLLSLCFLILISIVLYLISMLVFKEPGVIAMLIFMSCFPWHFPLSFCVDDEDLFIIYLFFIVQRQLHINVCSYLLFLFEIMFRTNVYSV